MFIHIYNKIYIFINFCFQLYFVLLFFSQCISILQGPTHTRSFNTNTPLYMRVCKLKSKRWMGMAETFLEKLSHLHTIRILDNIKQAKWKRYEDVVRISLLTHSPSLSDSLSDIRTGRRSNYLFDKFRFLMNDTGT